MMTVYGDKRSGNCLKVCYVADHLGLDYRFEDIDIMKGESRTAAYLAKNPAGQVPMVELDDGRIIAQSNAIMTYLAEGSALIPADAYDRAVMNQWLFWEQYSHEPYVAVCRFDMLYAGKSAAEREDWRVTKGEAALDLMEAELQDKNYFAGGQLSLADIALLAYTQFAHEGGFTLDNRPKVSAWLERTKNAFNLKT